MPEPGTITVIAGRYLLQYGIDQILSGLFNFGGESRQDARDRQMGRAALAQACGSPPAISDNQARMLGRVWSDGGQPRVNLPTWETSRINGSEYETWWNPRGGLGAYTNLFNQLPTCGRAAFPAALQRYIERGYATGVGDVPYAMRPAAAQPAAIAPPGYISLGIGGGWVDQSIGPAREVRFAPGGSMQIPAPTPAPRPAPAPRQPETATERVLYPVISAVIGQAFRLPLPGPGRNPAQRPAPPQPKGGPC